MNILLLIDHLTIGGAETHVLTLSAALIAHGHRVTLMSAGGSLCAALPPQVRFIPFSRPIRGRGALVGLGLATGQLRGLLGREQFDILHAHTRRTAALLWLVTGPARCFPRRPRAGRPVRIVTCHAKFRGCGRLSFWGDRTVAVSQDLARHLRDGLALSAGRPLAVIPNGIDTARFCPAGEGREGRDWRLTYASRLDGDCSAAAFLLLERFPRWRARAAAAGRRLYLTLVGGGECYGALLAMASALPPADRAAVTLTGALADTAEVFRATDLFFGVSRAALEALACGAAVVLCGDEGYGGRLTPENFDRLAAANFCGRGEGAVTAAALDAAFEQFIWEEPGGRRAQTADLRRRLIGRFDAAAMADATEAVYRAALEDAGAKRVLVAGYAGCGNLGDDAILRRLTAPEGQEGPVRFAATVGDVREAGEEFPGVHSIARRSIPALWRALRWADQLWLGGGSLLQDCSAHGRRSLAYYLGLSALCRLAGRPCLVVANGIGPLSRPLARWAVLRELGRAASISVRDEASRRFLVERGFAPARVALVPDPVRALRPASFAVLEQVLAAHLPALSQPFVCLVPRRGSPEDNAALVGAIREGMARGREVVLVPFDRRQDLPFCLELQGLCPGVHLFPTDRAVLVGPPEGLVAALFARSCGVVSSRLHGLILATVAGVEAMALTVEPREGKLREYARGEGLGEVSPKGLCFWW